MSAGNKNSSFHFVLFLRRAMLAKMPIIAHDTTRFEPPYEINGKGIPVNGMRDTMALKLIIICSVFANYYQFKRHGVSHTIDGYSLAVYFVRRLKSCSIVCNDRHFGQHCASEKEYKMKRTVLITGGHISPAIALIQELSRRED